MTEPRLLNPSVRLALGESPVWDSDNTRLLVADITGCAIHAFTPDGTHAGTWLFPSEVGSFGLCRSGRWIVALRKHVVLFDPRTGAAETIASPALSTPTRFNDGKVSPDGSFWVGTMDDRSPRTPIGALFRIAPDRSCTPVIDGLMVSNGLAWSGDGRTMFHSDSAAGRLDAWDFDPAAGSATNRQTIFEFTDPALGRPDGAACDESGIYWSAGVRAGRINRFSREGRLLSSDPFPCPGVTMPCFGGPDLKTVYWTSLRHALGAEAIAEHPTLGGVFVMEAPVAGAAIGKFKD
ncbi:MAG: SMP-30/gluconolactonase/LRE family protein [Acetobacteraceae bacterium]|nr:SMP-30/gluconolactonase/LRE family protein [Acetobacteraceae bacterium]